LVDETILATRRALDLRVSSSLATSCPRPEWLVHDLLVVLNAKINQEVEQPTKSRTEDKDDWKQLMQSAAANFPAMFNMLQSHVQFTLCLSVLVHYLIMTRLVVGPFVMCLFSKLVVLLIFCSSCVLAVCLLLFLLLLVLHIFTLMVCYVSMLHHFIICV
jgi:hypothetical protein